MEVSEKLINMSTYKPSLNDGYRGFGFNELVKSNNYMAMLVDYSYMSKKKWDNIEGVEAPWAYLDENSEIYFEKKKCSIVIWEERYFEGDTLITKAWKVVV